MLKKVQLAAKSVKFIVVKNEKLKLAAILTRTLSGSKVITESSIRATIVGIIGTSLTPRSYKRRVEIAEKLVELGLRSSKSMRFDHLQLPDGWWGDWSYEILDIELTGSDRIGIETTSKKTNERLSSDGYYIITC